jgi:2-polyprenyl-3-methyl-5-hydroxy-6-metoxy-1,4-benzoquinol methylase
MVGLRSEETSVLDDEQAYYGKQYWLDHQARDFGLPDIYQRARQDLPERCIYWLRTLLAQKTPPGEVLELGSAHGGFVALMNWAGYRARGLELSPWVVDFARKTFNVNTLLGALEDQELADGSLDVIVLNDLLEHLPDPEATLKRCADLLKADGLLLIQTPEYPEKTYQDLVADGELFLEYLHNEPVAREHLYLYSRRAVRRLLKGCGISELAFEPPIFAYDMFLVAAKRPLARNSVEQIQRSLMATPGGRLVQATLDISDRENSLRKELKTRLGEINSLRADIHTVCTREQNQVSALAKELQGVLLRESLQVYALTSEIERISARESLQVSTLQGEIQRLNREIARLEQGLADSEAQFESAQQAGFELENQLDGLRHALAQFKEVGTIGVRLGQRLHRISLRYPRAAWVVRSIVRAAG